MTVVSFEKYSGSTNAHRAVEAHGGIFTLGISRKAVFVWKSF
jgi:hypothetical protein